ncbi:Dot/Icm T4SS effector RavI [Legionella pneumophila serogroup 10]
MTRLEELLYTLTSIIIRYHDSQPKVLNKLIVESNPILLRRKALALAKEIIQDKDVECKGRLEELIQNCTKGYPDRKPFLHFILNEVLFLKSMLDRKNSFEPSKLEEYKKQITQLLIDLKQLMITPKSKTYEVKYTSATESSETSISLSGVKNDGYVGGEFCNSGNLIKEEVLEALNIHINSKNTAECSSDEEIKALAESLCLEHQNALLVPELLEKAQILSESSKEQEKELLTKTQQAETDKQVIIEQQATILEKDKEIEKLKERVSELTRSMPRPVFNPVLPLGYGSLFFNTRLGTQAKQQTTIDVTDLPMVKSSETTDTQPNQSFSMGNGHGD